MILQNISPTSVASERAFSNSNDFVTKKRSNLSDKTIHGRAPKSVGGENFENFPSDQL